MHAWLPIACALVLDGAAGLAGGLLPRRWLAAHTTALVAFAAGALVGAVFLDMLPEAFAALGGRAAPWALGGFVGSVAVEWSVGARRRRPTDVLPSMLLGSDALHNIGDGAAIAAAFLVDGRTGLAIAVAVIAHEVPQEIGDFALLERAGVPRGRALAALFAVQLTAFVGAAGTLAASHGVAQLADVVLAVAAGSFVYIAATDLLPTLREVRGRGRVVGFAAGVGALVLARLVFG